MLRRRFAPVMAAATMMILAACGGAGTPALTDAREIIVQGLEATAELESAHMVMAVDGTVSIPDLGGEFSLSGTEIEGDFDLANQEASATFAIPALLGITGEIIQIGNDTYMKTSMTGPMWVKTTGEAGDPVTEAMDPEEALAGLREFLDEDGVELEKLDDADCGDGTCYAVQLSIPVELLSDAGDAAGMDAGELFGDALVLDLLFDREDLYLTEVGTSISGEGVGDLTLTITLSEFNESVDVEAPPADEVTEDGGGAFPF